MAGIDLAKLVVKLEAQTAQYQAELLKARKQLGDFESYTRKSLAGVAGFFEGFAGALSIAALVEWTRSAAEGASHQRDLAQSAGVTAERFSELNYAILQDGGNADTLSQALFKINEQLEAAATKGGAAADLFAKFGITQAQIRSGAVGTDEALKRIADKFERMPAGVEKSALAAELLGSKLGIKLIPFLNEGSKGLEELARQARDAGAVIDEKTSAAVQRAGNQMAALVQTLQTKTLVALAAVAEEFGLIAKSPLDQKIEDIIKKIEGLNAELAILEQSASLAEEGGFLGALIHTGDAAKIEAIKTQLRELNAERAKAQQQALAGIGGKGAGGDKIGGVDPEAKSKLDALIASLKEQKATLGFTSAQVELYRLKVLGASQAQLEWAERILNAKGALAELNDKIKESQKIFEDTRTPLEQLQAQIVHFNELRNTLDTEGKPLIDDETYRRAVDNATKSFDELQAKANSTGKTMTEYWTEAAHNMQDAFANFLFDPFKDGLQGILANFGRVIQQMVAQAAAAEIFGSIAKSSFGSFLSSITGGATQAATAPAPHAAGGSFSANKPIMVGERGPEVLVPNTAGYIVPNDKLTSMGGVTQVFNITTPDAGSFRASQRQIQRAGRRSLGL